MIEFPTVYRDGGFDCVVGNPPYIFIDSIPEANRDYFRTTSETWDYRYDLYGVFIERGLNLLRDGGQFGYIIPHNILNNNSFQDLRSFVLNRASQIEILDFTGPVFENATNETMILNAKKEDADIEPVLRSALISPDEVHDADKHLTEYPASQVEELPSNPFLVRGGEWITELIGNSNTRPLDNFVHAVQGLRTGNNTERLSDEPTDPAHRPAIPGDDIFRYGYDWSGTYVLYDRELLSSDSAARPRKEMYWEADEKILVQEIRNVHLPRRIVACIDRDGHIGLNTTNAIILRDNTDHSLYYIKAVLSSSLINEFFRCCFVDNHIATQYLESIPLYQIDFNMPEQKRTEIVGNLLKSYKEAIAAGNPDSFLGDFQQYSRNNNFDEIAHDILVELVDNTVYMTDSLSQLNSDPFDHLDIPSDNLPDSMEDRELEELQVPAADIEDTPLTATADEYEGLRIENVDFKENNEELVMSVKVSYKPDNRDNRETDQYGRLTVDEFETYEAMVFTDLSEKDAALLRGFVPEAVERREGFAGFRRDATQTNTLIDRLNEITLPAVEEADNGLKQYVEIMNKSKQLEQRIKITDKLIDHVVYDLYGFTDKEI